MEKNRGTICGKRKGGKEWGKVSSTVINTLFSCEMKSFRLSLRWQLGTWKKHLGDQVGSYWANSKEMVASRRGNMYSEKLGGAVIYLLWGWTLFLKLERCLRKIHKNNLSSSVGNRHKQFHIYYKKEDFYQNELVVESRNSVFLP